mmetsp:Transcript_31800/g.91450  ORF Transcript_31800/g.91450 Transcript_31800/m.91450 type:complete len:215 (+) Transcript_31800:562-1206(+)
MIVSQLGEPQSVMPAPWSNLQGNLVDDGRLIHRAQRIELGLECPFGLRVYATLCQAIEKVAFAIFQGTDVAQHLDTELPARCSIPQGSPQARHQAAEYQPWLLGVGVELLYEIHHGVDSTRIHRGYEREVEHDDGDVRVLHSLPHLVHDTHCHSKEEVAVEPQDLDAASVTQEQLTFCVRLRDLGPHLREAGPARDAHGAAVLHRKEDQGQEQS